MASDFRHKILVFGIAALCSACISSCGPKLEEQVVSRFPNGVPSRIEYYISEETVRELHKEVRFHANGEKELEGTFMHDKKHGQWTQWHSNGEKWIEENYTEGLRHGTFTVYYPSGKRNYSGSYNYGAAAGTWKFWDEKGSILKEVSYDK
jgi:antitoxin component YwqK of YwqJK toxin-antitoxin module